MNTHFEKLLEPVWDSLWLPANTASLLATFSEISEERRALFTAYWLDYEVCNGGFFQFYTHLTGVHAPESAEAFVTLGMPRTADIVRRTISWFPTPYPRQCEAREKLLDAFVTTHPGLRSPFESNDDEYFAVGLTEQGGFEAVANEFASRFT